MGQGMTVFQDIRFGFRMLAKSPGFTLVAMTALGLGIGVNSMMFTIYNAAMFKTLPFEQPKQVVYISHRNFVEGRNQIGICYEDFTEYRQRMRTLAGMSAFDEGGLSVSDEHSLPERITGTRLSANTFSLIGQKVFLGRDFRAEDELQGADHVTILSYGLWQTRYGGDPSIPGKMLKVNGDYHTIVGVMPQDMAFPQESRLWIPLIPTPQERQLRAANLDVIGRLPVGVSAARAETEIKGVAASLALAHPETNKNLEPIVQPFIDLVIDENDQQILKTLVGAVAFVLLIACANVANLLLSRAC